MTGLITTIVGTVVAAGVLSASAAAPPPAADRAPARPARAVATSTATQSAGAGVRLRIPVVAFSEPQRRDDGRVRVVALLTEPGVRARVEIAQPSGKPACGSALEQGTPVVLDCRGDRTGSLRASYVLSDGRAGIVELRAG